jgi:tRNA U34 5-carboxymethylaminomethyl modifying GTPase MnmE/TrmE
VEDIYLNVLPPLQKVLMEMELHLNDSNKGEKLKNGSSVSIIGPPNAG